MDTQQKLPSGFSTPTELPDERRQGEWQQQNRSWWENNPMRYDWGDRIPAAEFSKEFYQEIDERFFSDSWRYMPWRTRPFEDLVLFEELAAKDVLEIGVGNGSHAQLIAPHCKSYTGIDLTEYAVKSTSKRFEVFDLKGTIRQMDAEKLDFPDASFDFIWTWGVIHHSANTGQILAEMNRVLRPGGKATIMVYHRSFLYHYIATGLFRGILQGGFFKGRSLHELEQLHTDGAIARFYRPAEWRALIESMGFVLEMETIKGQKSEVFLLPASKFKDWLMARAPNAVSRFITNACRQGSFLITTIRKA
ncbi:class I SAM-dependent methyltransferase [Prosthecobacter sp.]|uniref:class I SAM-dependent methyltransferase n=1 Tax=Prosthecobacter sp. TaxID=1965333 RepID=UPI001D4564CD|nr:class I SAM-dependent methyltransferase [Prosthecobacter sp.]MCB1275578.1 methyltransferase domain-containing protein [Prosthecobacter sp.]